MEKSEGVAGLAPKAKRLSGPPIPAADLAECAREQLDYLIDHCAESFCVTECVECGLLLAVRELLFDRFKVSER